MDITKSKIQTSLRDYLQIIFYRKWFFLLPFIIVFFTATIGSFFLPKYYRSSVLILVEEERPVNPLVNDLQYATVNPPATLVEQLKTLTEKILSYPNLITLVKTLKLDETVGNPRQYEGLIRSIRKRTEVKMKAPDVFQVAYEDRSPQLSQKIITNLLDIFIEGNLLKKTKEALVAVKFAEDQAKIYKKKLEDSERALYEFRSEHSLELPGKEVDLNVSMLINYQTSLTGIQMSLEEVTSKAELLNKQINGYEPVIISSDMIDLNPTVSRLNNKLLALEEKLEQLMNDDPRDPEVFNTQLEIESVREKLRFETEKLVDSETINTAPLFYQRLEQKLKQAQREADDLEVRRDSLKKLVREYEGKIESLPGQEKELVRLTRDKRVNENIYEMLMLKVEENRLTGEELKERGTKYTILEGARLPLTPSKPRIPITSIVSFFLGILTGFGCVFLIELADHSLRNAEDARKFLDLPILGAIPMIEDAEIIKAAKIRQRKHTTYFFIIVITLIIIAVASSCIRQSRITKEIIDSSNSTSDID